MKIDLKLISFAILISMGVVTLFFIQPYLMEEFIRDSPHMAINETGNIYPYFQHGVIVYFSFGQKVVLGGLMVAGIIFLLAGGIILRKWKFGK